MENISDYLLRQINKFFDALNFINQRKDDNDLPLLKQDLASIYQSAFGIDFDNQIDFDINQKDHDYIHSLFSLLLFDLNKTKNHTPIKIQTLEILLKKMSDSSVYVLNGAANIEMAKKILNHT